ATGGQPLEIWRAHVRAAIGTRRPGAMVVSEEKYDVGFGGSGPEERSAESPDCEFAPIHITFQVDSGRRRINAGSLSRREAGEPPAPYMKALPVSIIFSSFGAPVRGTL